MKFSLNFSVIVFVLNSSVSHCLNSSFSMDSISESLESYTIDLLISIQINCHPYKSTCHNRVDSTISPTNQMYIYRSTGWVPLENSIIEWIKEADADAILQNAGPSIGKCYRRDTMKIDGQVVTYGVRITWNGKVHQRFIEFPSGEECEVKKAKNVPKSKGMWSGPN